MTVVAEGRGAGFETHPFDVVMMLKRFASDEMLIQAGNSIAWSGCDMFEQQLAALVGSSFAFQEPVLCWPYRYMRSVGAIPTEARPLRAVKAAKKADYLALAQLLLAKAPTESSARSVDFLDPCQKS